MPSRIGSTKLTLRVPSQIAEDARVFCARHQITLAALTAEGLVLAMAEIGRPDGQTARRPTDQIDQSRGSQPVKSRGPFFTEATIARALALAVAALMLIVIVLFSFKTR